MLFEIDAYVAAASFVVQYRFYFPASLVAAAAAAVVVVFVVFVVAAAAAVLPLLPLCLLVGLLQKHKTISLGSR